MVQALPGAREEDLARVEKNVQDIGPVTSYLQEDPQGERLAEKIFAGLHFRELFRQEAKWQCTCSLQRMKRALLSLRAQDKELLLQDPQVEMTCRYCGTAYVLTRKELATLYGTTKKEG